MDKTRYKVLLVEDDKLDQMAFIRAVEEEELPYDCTIAGSSSEARNILASERFDIVITDYALGDGTGFDVLELVQNIPVILVTGTGDEELAVKAWQIGAYDYLIKDPNRNYLKTVAITIENTIKHRKMEERLRLLSHAMVSTDDCVYITDLEDKITFVNKAFCETYGYKEEEIIGQDCSILWEENSVGASPANTFNAVSGWEVGFFHKRKNGNGFPVSLTRSDVKDENGNEVALVVISHDISERMQIEGDLRTANKELKRENRLKSELIAAACEELRAPLALLKDIICDAGAGAFGELSPKLQENLKLADRNIDKVRGVVSDYLDTSSIDEKGVKLELSKVNPG